MCRYLGGRRRAGPPCRRRTDHSVASGFHADNPAIAGDGATLACVPNGKPGDHPLSDLLTWGHPQFGSPIDDLLKQINDLGGRQQLLDGPIGEALWDLWPKWGRRSGDQPEYDDLEHQLRELRGRLLGQDDG